MRAREHTDRFLAAWDRIGISFADLAVRRTRDVWIWHHALPLAKLPLAWARAENARKSEIYIRPARGFDWPLVFLDDIPVVQAHELLTAMPGMAVHTSPQGGCQLWLHCSAPLDERGRYLVQRALAHEHSGDPGSTSGEHLGRLAGVKNWKRSGVWVNVLCIRLDLPGLDASGLCHGKVRWRHKKPSPNMSVDSSASAREWGWVCGSLEAGIDPDILVRHLIDRARPRRGPDAERYARRTVERAIRHTR